ncbi:hypothetical protein, partial [Pseudomonas sp. MPR-R2A5]|uniref:hypothetical protein n=1 Tax=Pseudomonas sp. MPR-R2A5 TaxID=2070622 RepID=UPI001C45E1E1
AWSTSTAVTAMVAQTGKGAFERPGISRGLTLEKPLESSGFSRFRGLWKNLGKHAPHRLSDPDRFAKRPASQGIDRLSGA